MRGGDAAVTFEILGVELPDAAQRSARPLSPAGEGEGGSQGALVDQGSTAEPVRTLARR